MKRKVDVEGCDNFRDLGGYPSADGRRVRWRQLFRADALHGLTEAGVARLCGELAVGDVIDLRSSGELAIDGRGRLAAAAVRFHHLPLFDGETPAADREHYAHLTLGELYVAMANGARGPIAKVIETLAATDEAAVFHCAAGKDRTGVISALLLSLLGVRDELIVADYAATRDALDSIVEKLLESEGYRDMFERLPPDTLHADPVTMETFLESMAREHGSLRGYVREIGVSDGAVEALRRRLLEPV